MSDFEMVIGLEVHVELKSKSKIFCSCSTSFGESPNTHVCEVCLGLPGAMPRLNRSVVDMAVKAGLALNSDISRVSRFDRKNYFYPDSPKAFQISQLYMPLCKNGHVDIEGDFGNKTIRIHEIHMEDDAGKLIHDADANETIVDFNRAGVPLIEIVTEPDFRSSDEVIAFLSKLKDILTYIDVSDCRIEEGSMRCDVNLSVHLVGEEFGTRTEMKNLASFKAIAKAISYESKRQTELISNGDKVVQETRRFDEDKEITLSMRSKENANDYKYFPEPDLMPIVYGDSEVIRVKGELPELRDQKIKRYISDMGLSPYEVSTLTSSRELALLFEEVSKYCGSYKEASNFVLTDLLKELSDSSEEIIKLQGKAERLGRAIKLMLDGKINRGTSRECFSKVISEDIDPDSYIEEKGLWIISDEGSIEEIIREVLKNNQKAVSEYLNGNEKSFGFLMGQSMRSLKGQGSPDLVRKILVKYLSN